MTAEAGNEAAWKSHHNLIAVQAWKRFILFSFTFGVYFLISKSLA